MKTIKEKLKKISSSLVSVGDWVGNHLGALLTIGSAVVGYLFLRERDKRQQAETTAELKDQTNAISNLKEEVQDDQEKANASLNDYYVNAATYGVGKRKQKSTSSSTAASSRKRKAKLRGRTK